MLERTYAAAHGALLGLAFLKFGNPVILEPFVVRPQSGLEWLLSSWPVACGYGLLSVVTVLGLTRRRFEAPDFPRILLAMPLLWFGWQIVAAGGSVDPHLSGLVLPQFLGCVACFYLGCFVLGRVRDLRWFWGFLVAGFFCVMLAGFDQHYGGLEQSRRLLQEQLGFERMPLDFLKRLESNRIFGTLFYANALAGLIILVLPVLTWSTWRQLAARPPVVRGALTGLLVYMALACLYWSGSKGGWLVMAAVGAALVWHFLPPGRSRWAIAAVILAGALAGFALRFSTYFERGATSAVARMDCWRAAIEIARDRPLRGSGPGTFGAMYGRMRSPEAEMARLAHNDYLQQASDSGWPGFLLFTAWIWGGLWALYRKSRRDLAGLTVWSGLLGWACHSTLEFGLYIPAIGWTAFTFLGLSVGREYSNGHSAGHR